jgi:hypothetical protein
MALLYLDSSSFLTLLLQQEGHQTVEELLRDHVMRGDAVASSRLLWLEVRRVTIRERVLGNDIGAAVTAHLQGVEQLPVTDAVWERAGLIEQHVRTLDAIHLATCELTGATLLAAGLDSCIRRAAAACGVSVLPST